MLNLQLGAENEKYWKATDFLANCRHHIHLCTAGGQHSFIGLGRKQTDIASVDGSKALSLWNEGFGAKEKLIGYVRAVTKEGGMDDIPVENRIAVFDMDGTLAGAGIRVVRPAEGS